MSEPVRILYADDRVVVCLKPAGILSTDEPGGLPDLIRDALGNPQAVIRTVHRLDRVVSGVMVLARTARAASDLSAQIRLNQFSKEYEAVIEGNPPEEWGELRDLLIRDKAEKKTYITHTCGKNVQEAVLTYQVLESKQNLTHIRIQLKTGRTHQIRAQFSGHGMPLVGDRKYGHPADCPIALWSRRIKFCHPRTGEVMEFSCEPPHIWPWTEFAI